MCPTHLNPSTFVDGLAPHFETPFVYRRGTFELPRLVPLSLLGRVAFAHWRAPLFGSGHGFDSRGRPSIGTVRIVSLKYGATKELFPTNRCTNPRKRGWEGFDARTRRPPCRAMTTVCTCNPDVHWTHNRELTVNQYPIRGYCAT